MYILSKYNKLVYYILLLLLFTRANSDDIDLTLNVNNAKIFELNSLYIIERIKFSKSSNEPLIIYLEYSKLLILVPFPIFCLLE